MAVIWKQSLIAINPEYHRLQLLSALLSIWTSLSSLLQLFQTEIITYLFTAVSCFYRNEVDFAHQLSSRCTPVLENITFVELQIHYEPLFASHGSEHRHLLTQSSFLRPAKRLHLQVDAVSMPKPCAGEFCSRSSNSGCLWKHVFAVMTHKTQKHKVKTIPGTFGELENSSVLSTREVNLLIYQTWQYLYICTARAINHLPNHVQVLCQQYSSDLKCTWGFLGFCGYPDTLVIGCGAAWWDCDRGRAGGLYGLCHVLLCPDVLLEEAANVRVRVLWGLTLSAGCSILTHVGHSARQWF